MFMSVHGMENNKTIIHVGHHVSLGFISATVADVTRMVNTSFYILYYNIVVIRDVVVNRCLSCHGVGVET